MRFGPVGWTAKNAEWFSRISIHEKTFVSCYGGLRLVNNVGGPFGHPADSASLTRSALFSNGLQSAIYSGLLKRSTAKETGEANDINGLNSPLRALNTLPPGYHCTPRNASTVPVSVGMIMLVSP